MSEPIKILYAEDAPGHIALTRRMFADLQLPCFITHFENGQELIDHLESISGTDQLDNNTILLIDLEMPIMGGEEVLKRVKTDSRFSHLPAIIFTTSERRRDIDCCREIGCEGYFEKSFDAKDIRNLFETINQSLHGTS